jgi:hypothetical protein
MARAIHHWMRFFAPLRMTPECRAFPARASRSIISRHRCNLKSGGRAAALYIVPGAAKNQIAPRRFGSAGDARFAPKCLNLAPLPLTFY